MAKALNTRAARVGQPTARRTDSYPVLVAPYRRLLDSAGIAINGGREWDMQVHDPRLWRRLALGGSLALGEAYVDGWWDAPRLDELFERLVRARVDRRVFNATKLVAGARAALANLQRAAGARRVADVHYELGNDFYRAMLGPTMIYSCGYWRASASLDEAQVDKLELVCRKLGLERGMRVLDIGCGWGGFAKHAAERHGVSVVGVTIAPAQAEYARELCRELPVEIVLDDYRKIGGSFDRVVSIGMFEHVGRKNYRRFMRLARERLDRDGLLLLHTIGRNDGGSGVDPWVTRYVFPNSEVPTTQRMAAALDGLMHLEDWHNFGADYDPTLLAWYENFRASWPRFESRFGARFERLWTYYLLMFAGVFRGRGLDLWQLVLAPRGIEGGYRRPFQ